MRVGESAELRGKPFENGADEAVLHREGIHGDIAIGPPVLRCELLKRHQKNFTYVHACTCIIL